MLENVVNGGTRKKIRQGWSQRFNNGYWNVTRSGDYKKIFKGLEAEVNRRKDDAKVWKTRMKCLGTSNQGWGLRKWTDSGGGSLG